MPNGKCRAKERDNHRTHFSVRTKVGTKLIRGFPKTAVTKNFRGGLPDFKDRQDAGACYHFRELRIARIPYYVLKVLRYMLRHVYYIYMYYHRDSC